MSFSLQRALGAPGRPQTPDIDVGWSPGMPGTMFDVQRPLPMGLRAIPDPLHRHWTTEVPQSRPEEHPRNKRKIRKMMDAPLRHFCGPMPMEGSGMARRPIGTGLGTSNIVPGMPGDHPTSISGVWGRPGAPQRPPERTIFLQNPAPVYSSLPKRSPKF